ncbi:MAG: hypothetical protein ACK5CP_08135 [Bacteroidota bacterium]|jgi:hypothetical protein
MQLMKYFSCLIIAIILFNQTNAQTKLLQFSAGTNLNGTGDSFGLSFFTEYSKKFKKNFTWSNSLGGTINDGTLYSIFYQTPSGQVSDGSIRYTTAGFQAASHIGYSFIASQKHDFQLRLGSVIRYQSTSLPDAVSLEPITGVPFPVIVFQNLRPLRTLALGGSGQLVYNYTLKNNFCLGVLAGLQFDTEGDTIFQFMFTIGKRF